MKNKILKILLGLYLGNTLLVLSSSGLAKNNISTYQPHRSIASAVKNFLLQTNPQQNFNIGNIDRRLRLTKCNTTLNTRFPDYAKDFGRTSVEVSCLNPKPWSIRVSVYIKKFKNVLTLKHAVPAGTLIQPSDIRFSRQDISKIHGGYFTNIQQISNMVARRPMRAGKILSSSALKPQQLVTRGEEVLIVAETANLSIRVKGKALMNGTLGQRIKVRNNNSRRVFQATVISSGLVKVNM